VKRVAIIGGGASGLVCAIECAKAGLDVTLFEQNEKCGKKILVSGNGHCNISNSSLKIEDFSANNYALLEHTLKEFGAKKQRDYFESLGLLLQEREDGRLYPFSYEAKTVLELLLAACKQFGVRVVTNAKVMSISKEFEVEIDGKTKECFDVVVLANGSLAATHLGGNESGYRLARSFGHTITPLSPALVQLVSSSIYPKMMRGVKIEADVSLVINGIKEESVLNDLLFSEYGLSGLAILDLSQKAAKALSEHYAVDIVADLLPRVTKEQIASHIQKVATKNPSYSLEVILHTLLPKKIIQALLKKVDLDKESTFSLKLAKKLSYELKNWHFEITDTKGFRYAEVCAGGVDSCEVHKSFESKKQKNLYIIGELLDVVGKRGGYNFAFAWASGYIAAKAIK